MEPDYNMDDDIAVEEELFGCPAPPEPEQQPLPQPRPPLPQPRRPLPQPSKEKKKRKPGEAMREAFEDAKKKGHTFVYKQGAMDFGQYRSCQDAKTFFKQYNLIPRDRRAAFEALRDGSRIKYYLDIEHKELLKMPTDDEKLSVIKKTGDLLAQLIPGVDPTFTVWDGSREITRPFDGAKRFKLSLHMIHSELACVNLAQAENITNALNDLARKDEQWSSYAFYDTLDEEGKTIQGYLYDPSVYKKNQLMRLPMSWKFVTDRKTWKQKAAGTPLLPFSTLFPATKIISSHPASLLYPRRCKLQM